MSRRDMDGNLRLDFEESRQIQETEEANFKRAKEYVEGEFEYFKKAVSYCGDIMVVHEENRLNADLGYECRRWERITKDLMSSLKNFMKKTIINAK